MPTKQKLAQKKKGGSVASDAVMSCVPHGSIRDFTNRVVQGGSIASDAVTSRVPASAMLPQTNFFCGPVGSVGGRKQSPKPRPKSKSTLKSAVKPKPKPKSAKKMQGGSANPALSIPTPSLSMLNVDSLIPKLPGEFLTSPMRKTAAYPECVENSAFVFGGVMQEAGSGSKKNAVRNCGCSGGACCRKSAKMRRKSAK